MGHANFRRILDVSLPINGVYLSFTIFLQHQMNFTEFIKAKNYTALESQTFANLFVIQCPFLFL